MKLSRGLPLVLTEVDMPSLHGFQIMGKPAGEVFRTWAAAARAGRTR